MTVSERPRVRVTEIGEYIRHSSCERRFRLEIDNRRLARRLPFSERLFNTLDPVLQEVGQTRESDWEQSLQQAGFIDLTGYSLREGGERVTPWEQLAERARGLQPGQLAYGREVSVQGDLGAWHVEGRIDFVLILRDGERPKLRLVECKASRRDRTYQRIQVVLYRMVVERLLAASPVEMGGVQLGTSDCECVVARIDETTDEAQEILALPPLDLDMEREDVERLLAPDGTLQRIVHTPLDDLSFCLNQTCDGCVFNVHCLPESARKRRLELLGLDPTTVRALRTAGVATIDDLADLDLTGAAASAVRADQGFTENLTQLQVRAKARRRTLPGGGAHPDAHEVEALPFAGKGQLPEHEQGGHRLLRVYLAVDYDYAENRVGALSAHVTTSEWWLHTGFVQEGGRWQPDPAVKERLETGRDEHDRPIFDERPVQGRDVVQVIRSEWSGVYAEDSGAERQLIQSFLHELVEAIAEVAEVEEAPVHFYVWSRGEIQQLMEACSRVGSRLLSSLRELMGCRESLEQLIYSCLQDEVEQRYGLGWTGRGLAVVTSLGWFGRRYHWRRRVMGAAVSLDWAFTQDIFDFKTRLRLDPGGSWAGEDDERAPEHTFEIRSRFHDSLTAPYWRAYWRTLPEPETVSDTRVANSIRRYNRAAKPGYLKEYLKARVQALRWVEEGVRYKNAEIVKPLLRIPDLVSFSLGVNSTAQAAIDFLRLDQHVKVTDWIAQHLVPPANRVPLGRTLPVSDLTGHQGNRISARINLDRYDIDLPVLAPRCTISEGAMVRLSPCWEDPHQGQSIGQLVRAGKTCRVDSIDWETGQIMLTALWGSPTRYVLQSGGASDGEPVFDYATVDESVSDFVAGVVDARLGGGLGAYVHRWLDPERPSVPPQVAPHERELAEYRAVLERLRLANDQGLATDQVRACLDGLGMRIQLLLGPPGTGKTTTTAAAVLLRILARRLAGDIVLIAAHTHTALDTLLGRLDGVLDAFREAADQGGLRLPEVRLAKVHSSAIGSSPAGRVQDFISSPSITFVNGQRSNAVLVIGGTTNAILKLARELCRRQPFSADPEGFQATTLIVDEASMMVFPHFLALATLVKEDGEIMLAGDHRQLAPIVAHDWESEDRPPMVAYQPFSSAYGAIQRIIDGESLAPSAVGRSALQLSFRLPPVIVDLIARLYRQLDRVELEGLPRAVEAAAQSDDTGSWECAWAGSTGLFLVLHSERESKQSNVAEAEIIVRLLESAGALPPASVAIVTPHRAQRSLLKTLLADRMTPAGPVDVIDTVERLQGGERPTIIVSGTVSDPAAISASAEFILSLPRQNVAFSRVQERLIVVCSEALVNAIPPETEHYKAAMLWKSLRGLCTRLVAEERVNGYSVRVLTVPIPGGEVGLGAGQSS